MSASIALRGSSGLVALVDDDALAALAEFKWYATDDGYARRNLPQRGTQRGSVAMHREILGLVSGDPRHTDHINGNRLDNRRANLRIVTQAQNNQNVRHRVGRSGHRGVYWHGHSGMWRVKVVANGREISGGYFREIEDAAVAARALIREHLPFAVIEEAA